jgi:hypothetical protein
MDYGPLTLSGPRYFVEHPGYLEIVELAGPYWCNGCDRIMASVVGHVLVCPWRPESMATTVTALGYMHKINVSIDFANPVPPRK